MGSSDTARSDVNKPVHGETHADCAAIERACEKLRSACRDAIPAVERIADFVPPTRHANACERAETLIDLVGVHLRARIERLGNPDLGEYLQLAGDDAELQRELRTLFRNVVGAFKRELDIEVVHSIYPLTPGARSVVYAARDRAPDLDQAADVAVKVLHPELRDDVESRERFHQEVELLKRARMHTERVVRVFEAGHLTYLPDNVRRCPAIVMEHCHGTLHDRIGDYRGDAAAELVLHIAVAVQKLHDDGIVLRDLKPSNVLMRRTADGDVPVLADLGIAKDQWQQPDITTDEIAPRGTPGHRSPQAVRGERLNTDHDEKSEDVWGIGALLFQMLHPDHRSFVDREHDLDDPSRLREMIAQGLPQVDDVLRAIINDCLSPRCVDRPSMADVSERLRLHASLRTKHPNKKNRDVRIVATCMIIFVAAAIWFTVRTSFQNGDDAPGNSHINKHPIQLHPALWDTRFTDAEIVLIYRIDPDKRSESLDVILGQSLDSDSRRAFDKANIPQDQRDRLFRKRSETPLFDGKDDLVAYRYSLR